MIWRLVEQRQNTKHNFLAKMLMMGIFTKFFSGCHDGHLSSLYVISNMVIRYSALHMSSTGSYIVMKDVSSILIIPFLFKNHINLLCLLFVLISSKLCVCNYFLQMYYESLRVYSNSFQVRLRNAYSASAPRQF